MDYIITRIDTDYNNELQHYGVLGMKWGVRRANNAYSNATTKSEKKKALGILNKNMAKANKKLNKLDAKISKKRTKAEKAYYKYAKQASKSVFRSESKVKSTESKYKKKDAKYANSIVKANKWYKEIEKEFKNTPVSMTSKQQALGKKYVDTMKARLARTGFDT